MRSARMPHQTGILTRAANLRFFDAPFCNLTIIDRRLHVGCHMLSFVRVEFAQKSKNAVFLYVPLETCGSHRDPTALDGIE